MRRACGQKHWNVQVFDHNKQMFRRSGDMNPYTLAHKMEEIEIPLLAERYPERNFQTNVEF